MSRALKRATRDFGLLSVAAEDPDEKIIVAAALANRKGSTAHGTDLFHWRITLQPPAESIYAANTYDILFTISEEKYPFAPPEVTVVSPIFSPVVAADTKKVCEGLLNNDLWQPATNPVNVVHTVADFIFVTFAKQDIINEEAANLYAKNIENFKKRVNEIRGKTDKWSE